MKRLTPEPNWSNGPDPYALAKDLALDIVGQKRSTKTNLSSEELATQLDLIESQYHLHLDTQRQLHAHWYWHWEPTPSADSEYEWVKIPEVLTDEQVEDLYPAIRTWRLIHETAVEYYNSVDGFGVKSATGYQGQREQPRDREETRRESSAGTDRKRGGAEKW